MLFVEYTLGLCPLKLPNPLLVSGGKVLILREFRDPVPAPRSLAVPWADDLRLELGGVSRSKYPSGVLPDEAGNGLRLTLPGIPGLAPSMPYIDMGLASTGLGMYASEGNAPGLLLPDLDMFMPMFIPCALRGVGIFVSPGSTSIWRPRRVIIASFPALLTTQRGSTPSEAIKFVRDSVEPCCRGLPDGSCMLPRCPDWKSWRSNTDVSRIKTLCGISY